MSILIGIIVLCNLVLLFGILLRVQDVRDELMEVKGEQRKYWNSYLNSNPNAHEISLIPEDYDLSEDDIADALSETEQSDMRKAYAQDESIGNHNGSLYKGLVERDSRLKNARLNTLTESTKLNSCKEIHEESLDEQMRRNGFSEEDIKKMTVLEKEDALFVTPHTDKLEVEDENKS